MSERKLGRRQRNLLEFISYSQPHDWSLGSVASKGRKVLYSLYQRGYIELVPHVESTYWRITQDGQRVLDATFASASDGAGGGE